MYLPFSMISVARTAHEGRLEASERIPLFCHQNSFMPDNCAQALYLTRWGIFGDPLERDNYIRLKRPIRGRKTEGGAEDDLEIIYLWVQNCIAHENWQGHDTIIVSVKSALPEKLHYHLVNPSIAELLF
jgi:hypothetical protein